MLWFNHRHAPFTLLLQCHATQKKCRCDIVRFLLACRSFPSAEAGAYYPARVFFLHCVAPTLHQSHCSIQHSFIEEATTPTSSSLVLHLLLHVTASLVPRRRRKKQKFSRILQFPSRHRRRRRRRCTTLPCVYTLCSMDNEKKCCSVVVVCFEWIHVCAQSFACPPPPPRISTRGREYMHVLV